MWPVFPALDTLKVAAVLFVIAMTSARLLQPAFWRTRPVRLAVFAAFGAMLAGLAVWATGRSFDHLPTVHAGAGLTYAAILVTAPAILVLPVTALTDRVLSRLLLRAPAPARASSPPTGASTSAPAAPRRALSRRSLLRASTLSIPAMAAMTGASGLVTAGKRPRMPVIPMRFENLHPDLEGLRILHLSDLHLGVCAGLADLERALEAAVAARQPDLIVLTGDLADDPSLIPGALALVARAGARHGALASLGNHEYLHDIAVTRPLYEASPVPLLVSAGRTLAIGKARLYVGGSDDPLHIEGDIEGMVRPSIERAADAAPPDADFKLLLCHRPEGFGPAASTGFDLTLSGHTHGGQLGVMGRSVLEWLRPGTGWWGTYARKRPGSVAARRTKLESTPSRLYTTSGFGHWFPFRLGCPTEMPVIILERGPRDAPPTVARAV